MNNRVLIQNIMDKITELQSIYAGQAPLNVLYIELDMYTQSEIKNGIDELLNKNIIERINDNYYKRC